MGRRRKPGRTSDSYRPDSSNKKTIQTNSTKGLEARAAKTFDKIKKNAAKAKKSAPKGKQPARTKGATLAKAFRGLEPVGGSKGDYIVSVADGLMTIEGDNGEKRTVEIEGDAEFTTLVSKRDAGIFSVLKAGLEIEEREDNLRITEDAQKPGSTPTGISLKIRKPVGNYVMREIEFPQYSQAITRVFDKQHGYIGEIQKARDGNFYVYAGSSRQDNAKKVQELGYERATITPPIKAASMPEAKRIARSLPVPEGRAKAS